jgi:anion-transporting  ArsA/GET3 family ATPase
MVKKAHFVTGKGGVGKSLIAAALARSFSLENQHVLLTELNENSFYQDYLQLKDIGYAPSPWIPNVDVSQWSPQECLKEYALHLLKIKSLYKLFLENPVSKSLIQVAPGLQELALLGKVTSSPRKHGPSMNYDTLVIDSFSTGHFLSLLRAPSAMAQAIQFGPMGEQSRSIDSWIRNPDFIQIHLVSLAEELPMTESVELYKQLLSEFKIKPQFYLNKITDLNKEDLKNVNPEFKEDLEVFIENEKNAIALL